MTHDGLSRLLVTPARVRAMKHKAHLGTTTSQKTIVVEQGLVQRFVDALDVSDPLSRQLLPHAAAATLGDYQSVIDLLELKPKQVLHSRELIAVFHPVCVGDQLTISTTLREVDERPVGGNPMGFVTIDVVGVSPKGEVWFEAQRVLAIRGGFPRRS
jgi:hypothetical protein